MQRWYKKIIVFILMMALLQYPIGVFAADQQTMLRIGLITEFAEKSQLQISDKKVSIGYSISDVYNEIATLESETGYRFTKATKYYAKSTTKYKTYTSAQTAVSSLVKKYGITAVVGFMAKDDIRVFIGESNSEEQLKKVITKVKGSGISFETLGGDNGYRVKMEGSKQAIVYDGNGVNGYPQIAPIVENSDGDKVLTIGTKQYRGRLEIGSYGKNSVTAVNVIAIDDYLYGVVPAEMPSLWPEEALKAQAVVARTYAVHKGGVGGDSKASNPYQLNDTTASQVYKGYQGEVTTTNQAVDKTSEEYIYYNGQLIDATFFSTSGGATNNSEDVWSGVVPYLRGVSDRYELEPEKKPWILTFTKEDIASKLSAKGKSVGAITSVKEGERLDSGYLRTLDIKGKEGSITLEKEAVRNYFGAPSAKYKVISSKTIPDQVTVLSKGGKATTTRISSSSILSASGTVAGKDTSMEQFVVMGKDNFSNYPKEVPKKTDTYYFAGMGYGHGVGMSQSGAKGMAKEGYSYKEIIKHYYTGVEIIKK